MLLTVLATAFMVARFAAKYTTANKVNITSDDALLVAALVGASQGLPSIQEDSHPAAAHVFALRWSNLGYVPVARLSEHGILMALAITLGGAGEHAYALTKSQLEVTAMIFWICQFPHAVALTLVRWALVVFLIRTFFARVTSSRLRSTAYCCLGFSMA
ncbi:hypothetical protein P171DRAFT_249517 [Karstenula rhodostoma CBS 690.94]|uniref:Uncharacterized protein n=1 Tax=Karstenula rhodostoma CBS 690.94 TaxID=1392251 RepID=A0A9P4UFJ3_9PLEO|nr:hypothetical protein P171DRAFT_249517 [Karstenula rhodostoma CBS 690.94]